MDPNCKTFVQDFLKLQRAMARNIEIKARIDNAELCFTKVKALADSGPRRICQDDTFFNCPNGRLKLRAFSSSEAELIFYHRPDCPGPKESVYSIVSVENPDLLREVLTAAWGQIGRVRKIRNLFLLGRTRIHLDCVEGLGDFLELEVVLSEAEPTEEGIKVATDLLNRLVIPKENLVEGAYLDLLRSSRL